MDIFTLPKAELHCHLDGSLPLQTLQKLLGRTDVTEADVQAPARCRDLAQYLEKFDLPLQGLQTAENLQIAAHDLVLDMHSENVVYAEIRFAPLLHTQQGLRPEAVIENLLTGIRQAEKETAGAIKAHLIVCAMQHYSPEENMRALRAALGYRSNTSQHGPGVCALDLAGNEALHSIRYFSDLFTAARKENLPFTIHAGECGSPLNVKEASELGARRVGHGIALMKDETLMKELARTGLGVEMCPTSNLQTAAIADWADYPLRSFEQAGLQVSVNTDNRTVSGTTLTRELQFLLNSYQDEDLIRRLIDNAFQTAFAY